MKLVSFVLLNSYGWQCLNIFFLGLSGTVSNESGDNIGGLHLQIGKNVPSMMVLNLKLNSNIPLFIYILYCPHFCSLNVFEKWYVCVC